MKKKIVFLLFALFLFFSMGILAGIFYMSDNISELKNIIKLHEVEELRRSLLIKIQNVQSDLYVFNPINTTSLDSIIANAADLDETAQQCTSCHHSPALTKRIKNLQRLIKEYETSLSYYLTASANTDRIAKLKAKASEIGDQLQLKTGTMSHIASQNLKEKTGIAMQRLNYVRIILFITILITFFFGSLIAIHLTRSVTRPISALVNATRMISSGKFGATISYTDKTEFGELANHFNTMSTVIKESYDKIQKEMNDRGLAEEALRQSELKFRTFFEMSPVGILIYPAESNPFDRKFEHATFNTSFSNFFGFTKDALIRKSMRELSAPEDIEKNIILINELLTGKRKNFMIENRFINNQGKHIWGYLSATTTRDVHGRPMQFILTLVDITERKTIEEEQMKIEKLESIGILAGGIAHDFNNILTSMTINLARSKTSLQRGDKLFRTLSDIEDACNRAKKLTSKLITFSKGGAPIKRVTSLKNLLKDSTLFALKGSEIKSKFDIDDDLWHAEVDEEQINQVIVNLVINAVQAMPEGGELHVKAENVSSTAPKPLSLPEMDFVKVTVSDNGHGIREEHLKKIFDPYFTTKSGGSGLGLSSAYSIIKNHNGLIDVTTEENKGSSFFFYLPAIKNISHKQIKKHATGIKKGGKVLFMDDDDSVRETLGKTLLQLGYKIALAKDGTEAINLYKDALNSGDPFDAVIMDLTISYGMGGRETIRELLSIDPDVKAIVSSGYSDDAVMSDYKEHGFKGVISKPYEIEELNSLLQDIISK